MNGAGDPQYFFIIGAMKAGTTSLYNYLAGHPELYASPKKEPRVFRDGADTTRLRAKLGGLFRGRRDERWCFEGSTAYTKYPVFCGVPERRHSVVPEARFVYLVRNPVDRAWSHYVHNLAHGREMQSFAQALVDHPQYLDISRYNLQLAQYLKVFPQDRILVQVFEEMVADPVAAVREVSAFLGVDQSYTPPTRHVSYNASRDKRIAVGPLRVARKLGLDRVMSRPLRYWLKTHGAPLPAKKTGLTADVRASVIAAVRDDCEAFFDVLGRRIPAWAEFA